MSIITKLKILNFKSFEKFELEFSESVNIIVGNNEVSKSTILETIHLCLTGYFHGKILKNDLAHIF
ncbi:AAA family ATPase [Chryseobacterium sp. PS-8]|uniref:AAA family ATPase n=1 Tax=Chryseobacterium indicum TaxID=2766954 RepID=A0ABS9C2C6_9FLAO|nr:AAA family ATPase [Chryseobacterium sp. PS-8]